MPLSAILLIVGAVCCFTMLDAIVKFLATRYPVPLLVWARYAVQALAIVLWLAADDGRAAPAHARGSRLQLVRGAIAAAFVAVLLQRAQVPAARRGDRDQLHDADARDPARRSLLLKERMTRPRIAFVVAGIAGMLLIVRPGAAIFQGAALLALGRRRASTRRSRS